MHLKRATLGLLFMGLMVGCHHKKHPTDVQVYDQPTGPTSGLVKVIDTNTGDDGVWWYWFEFMDNDHLIKEYRVCPTGDFIPKGLAGVISLSWSSTDNCFVISSFNRREDSEGGTQ